MFNQNFVRGRLGALLAGCLIVASAGLAEPPSRIRESLDSGRTFQLQGNTHPLISSVPDQGATAEQTPIPRVTIDFKMSAAQQTSLTKLLAEQQDPSSSQYHKWLTPEQYGEQFGISKNDLAKVEAWAKRIGFTNIQVARAKNSISMAGTVGLAQYAFQTPIHNFNVNGRLHYANTADPYLPAAIQGIAAAVRGLSDLHPRPHSRPVSHPRFTSSLSGDIYMAPGDFATIYDVQTLYNNGIDGTGEKIAIAGQTDIQTIDIEAFQTAAGLTVKAPTVILDGADPGFPSDGDLSEAELDVEWAGAVARGATIVYVNSQDAFQSAIYAIDNQVANVVSLTYGGCEAQTANSDLASLTAAFQQANAEGITVTAASGDSGAADCDYSSNPNTLDLTATNGLAVDFPASSPYVTGLGGTAFNEGSGDYWGPIGSNNSNGGSALSYIPEMAWNDDCSPGTTTVAGCAGTANYGLSATGGGVSTLYTKPSWQVGTGVPADGFRDVPDVSVDSSPNHDGYLICETPTTNGVAATTSSCVNGTFRDVNGDLNVIGGTSVASPTFAGIVALIDQLTGSAQGNVNQRLYALASLAPDAFHDITVGSNIVPCTVGTTDCTTGILGYNTTTGYDQVTGLGTIDANNLAQSWAPSYTLSINPSTLTLTDSSSGTATVTVAAVGGFTGTVSFTCSVPSTLTNTACTVPGSVSGSGTTTVTIANTNTTSSQWFNTLRGVRPGGNLLFAFSALGLMLATALAALNKRRRVPFASVAFLSAVLMTGCGGGSSNSSTTSVTTPASVTGTVTITAVSTATSLASSITKTITIAVTEP